MKNRNDFTLSDNFTDLPKYVNYLHEVLKNFLYCLYFVRFSNCIH